MLQVYNGEEAKYSAPSIYLLPLFNYLKLTSDKKLEVPVCVGLWRLSNKTACHLCLTGRHELLKVVFAHLMGWFQSPSQAVA